MVLGMVSVMITRRALRAVSRRRRRRSRESAVQVDIVVDNMLEAGSQHVPGSVSFLPACTSPAVVRLLTGPCRFRSSGAGRLNGSATVHPPTAPMIPVPVPVPDAALLGSCSTAIGSTHESSRRRDVDDRALVLLVSIDSTRPLGPSALLIRYHLPAGVVAGITTSSDAVLDAPAASAATAALAQGVRRYPARRWRRERTALPSRRMLPAQVLGRVGDGYALSRGGRCGCRERRNRQVRSYVDQARGRVVGLAALLDRSGTIGASKQVPPPGRDVGRDRQRHGARAARPRREGRERRAFPARVGGIEGGVAGQEVLSLRSLERSATQVLRRVGRPCTLWPPLRQPTARSAPDTFRVGLRSSAPAG